MGRKKKRKNRKLPEYITERDGKWHARKVYYINGNRKEVWRRCKIQTEEFAELLVKQIDAEIELLSNPSKRAEQTFGDFFEYWFSEKCEKQNAEETRNDHRHIFDKHLKSLIDIPFEHLKPQDIKNICNKLENSGKKRTAKKVHSLVRLVYNDAVKLIQYKNDNPADQMFPPVYQAPEAECLDLSTAKLIVKTSLFEQRGIIIRFALETAMRPNEYFGLQWNHIDFEKRLVKVRQQVYFPKGGGFEFVPPKRNSKRTIAISETLMEELMECKKKQTDNNLNLVFVSRSNTPISRQNFARRDFKRTLRSANNLLSAIAKEDKKAIKKYRLTKKEIKEFATLKELSLKLSPYCLRHTAATLLLSSNHPLTQVSALLGHKDISITAKVYSHYLPGTEHKTNEVLSGMVY